MSTPPAPAAGCPGKKVSVSAQAAHLGIVIGVSCFSVEGLAEVDKGEFERLVEAIRGRLAARVGSADALRNDPVARAYRDFYWRIGIDPTKTRPSGEALARRVLLGKGLPQIHPVVDAGNLASAETLVPVGLYDADVLPGDAVLTVSRGGERFLPIGGEEELLPPGIPVLLSEGVVVHVYPHRDSRLTAVRPGTRRVLAIAAGVPGVGGDELLGVLRRIFEYLERLRVEYRILQDPVLVSYSL